MTLELEGIPTHSRALPRLPSPDMPAAISEQFRNSDGRAPIHLSHARSLQDLSGRQESPRQRQPLFLPGRENRRARRQWLGQVDADAHHGWARHRVHRRGLRRRGREGRLPAAGARSRPRPRREGQRHARREREAGDPRPLQRARHELFRRDRRRNDAASRTRSRPRACGISRARSSRRWTRLAVRRTIPT